MSDRDPTDLRTATLRQRARLLIAGAVLIASVTLIIGWILELGAAFFVAVSASAVLGVVIALLVRDALLGRLSMGRVRLIIALLIPAVAIAAVFLARLLR